MENFPSNAQRPTSPVPEKKDEKKIERVVAGEVIRRKKSLGKRFTETFIGGEDARGVWGFVVMDVLVPAAKDMAADAVSQGIERMLFGEARSTSRRTGARPGSGGANYGHISYNRAGPGAAFGGGRREDPRPPISRRARSMHNFDEIVLPTRVEADEVLSQMFEIVSKFEVVTVADLYEMVGITGAYTDRNYGWTDIRGAGAVRVRSGYLLDLPKPEALD